VNRFDAIGLWWSDFPVAREKGQRVKQTRAMPVPDTGWTCCTDLPNLASAKVLGLDTETKDLELLTRGPGAVRGAAHAVGVSVAVEDCLCHLNIMRLIQVDGEVQIV
jgi:hypothetical protein